MQFPREKKIINYTENIPILGQSHKNSRPNFWNALAYIVWDSSPV